MPPKSTAKTAPMDFAPKQRVTTVIPFTLGDDHIYQFVPPKQAVMMMPILEPVDPDDDQAGLALTRATFDWLGAGLSDDDNERIKKRLKDPKDNLDVDDLADVVKGLSEKVAEYRPST